MTQRTDTYDDDQWQLVPKEPTDEIYQAYLNPGWNFYSMWGRMLSAAPTPPVAEPVDGLDDLLRDVERVMAKNIYPKPDAGPEHPWNVLKRLRKYRAALAQRGDKT